jgi:hypothetical protein
MRKPSNSFSKNDDEYWPLGLADLKPHYCNVEEMIAPQTYPFDVAPYSETLKTQAFETVAEDLPAGRPQPERVLVGKETRFRPRAGSVVVRSW